VLPFARARVDVCGNVPDSGECDAIAIAVQTRDRQGRAARTAQGEVSAFHDFGRREVRRGVENANRFDGGKMGVEAMPEAIGHHNDGIVRGLFDAPGVATDFLAGLGDVDGAELQRGQAPAGCFGTGGPAGEDGGAAGGFGLEIGSRRQPDNGAEPLTGRAARAVAIAKSLIEVPDTGTFIESEKFERRRTGLIAINRLQQNLASAGVLQKIGADLGGHDGDLLRKRFIEAEIPGDEPGHPAGLRSLTLLIDTNAGGFGHATSTGR
jgi:hypothetical protein